MASRAKERPWQGEPLPRGQRKLDAEVVRAHQRERVVRAMLECVASNGYQDTTVAQVATTARVSPNAFYEFFADKADCFLTASKEAALELLGDLVATGQEDSWISALDRGLELYLRAWGRRPTFGRAYFLGLTELGEAGREQLNDVNEAFAAMLRDLGRWARIEQPQLEPLAEIVPRVLVTAVADLVTEHIRTGHADRLPDLHGPLFSLSVKLLADDETARAVTGI